MLFDIRYPRCTELETKLTKAYCGTNPAFYDVKNKTLLLPMVDDGELTLIEYSL